MELPASVRFGYCVYACLRTHNPESLMLEEVSALEFLNNLGTHRLTPNATDSTYLSRNLMVLKAANRVNAASCKSLKSVAKLDRDEALAMTLVTLGLFGLALKAVPETTEVRVSFGSDLSECLRLLPAASPELTTMLRSVLGLVAGSQPQRASASTHGLAWGRLHQMDGTDDYDSGKVLPGHFLLSCLVTALRQIRIS